MLKIMIVDNDYIILEELKEIALDLDYEVIGVVGSGEEAVEMATELKPDVILMDIVMPGGIDGTKSISFVRYPIEPHPKESKRKQSINRD